jgi:hypothetical protein
MWTVSRARAKQRYQPAPWAQGVRYSAGRAVCIHRQQPPPSLCSTNTNRARVIRHFTTTVYPLLCRSTRFCSLEDAISTADDKSRWKRYEVDYIRCTGVYFLRSGSGLFQGTNTKITWIKWGKAPNSSDNPNMSLSGHIRGICSLANWDIKILDILTHWHSLTGTGRLLVCDLSAVANPGLEVGSCENAILLYPPTVASQSQGSYGYYYYYYVIVFCFVLYFSVCL